MAIPPSRLSDFIGSSRLPEEILRKLREASLLSEEAPDTKVLRVVQEAIAEEDEELEQVGEVYATASSRIPGLLFDPGYLSPKGLEWRVPYCITDSKERSRVFECRPSGRLWIRAEDLVSVIAMLDEHEMRLSALRELRRRGAEATVAIPRLMELLRDRDQGVVTITLDILKNLGRAARNTLPVLAGLANDEDLLIRLNVQAAIKAISREDTS
jgi:hypothetical protein